MIKVIKHGKYILFETSERERIIFLDRVKYFWRIVPSSGQQLEFAKKTGNIIRTLQEGNYRLYEVSDEHRFSPDKHLELCLGGGHWQNYLLPSGLPNDKHKRSRLINTEESISAIA